MFQINSFLRQMPYLEPLVKTTNHGTNLTEEVETFTEQINLPANSVWKVIAMLISQTQSVHKPWNTANRDGLRSNKPFLPTCFPIGAQEVPSPSITTYCITIASLSHCLFKLKHCRGLLRDIGVLKNATCEPGLQCGGQAE